MENEKRIGDADFLIHLVPILLVGAAWWAAHSGHGSWAVFFEVPVYLFEGFFLLTRAMIFLPLWSLSSEALYTEVEDSPNDDSSEKQSSEKQQPQIIMPPSIGMRTAGFGAFFMVAAVLAGYEILALMRLARFATDIAVRYVVYDIFGMSPAEKKSQTG